MLPVTCVSHAGQMNEHLAKRFWRVPSMHKVLGSILRTTETKRLFLPNIMGHTVVLATQGD